MRRSTNLWTELKEVKLVGKKSLFEYHCRIGFGFYETQRILELVAEFEKQMNVTSTELRFTNITSEYLEIAAEMFIYLINCPRYSEKWYESWFKDNKHLLETESLGTIILTLNRLMIMMKTKSNPQKEISQKLFDKITNLLSLNYKQRKSMLLGNSGNTSLLGQYSDADMKSMYSITLILGTGLKLILMFRHSGKSESPCSHFQRRKENITISLHTFL